MRRSTMKNEQMALLFSEATPYIQKYHGKTLVIKYGGNAMVNDDLKLAVMNDLVTLTLLGVRVVLVHGGGPAINSMLKKVGKESKFVGGLRYTDEETMGIVQQVLAGQVNKDLVALLKGRGVGLCGMDGHMIMCKRKSDVDLATSVRSRRSTRTLIDTCWPTALSRSLPPSAWTKTASPTTSTPTLPQRRSPLPCTPKSSSA